MKGVGFQFVQLLSGQEYNLFLLFQGLMIYERISAEVITPDCIQHHLPEPLDDFIDGDGFEPFPQQELYKLLNKAVVQLLERDILLAGVFPDEESDMCIDLFEL